MSLQRVVFRASPTLSRRCMKSSALDISTLIHDNSHSWLWMQQQNRKIVQSIHNSSFGNAGRSMPNTITITIKRVLPGASFNQTYRLFATKAVHQDETKWWESLWKFLRGCRSSKHFNLRRLLGKSGKKWYWKVEKRWKKTRRAYKNSWLSTMVAAGSTAFVGDILAQTVYPVLFPKGKSSNKESDARKLIDNVYANMKQINFCQSTQFALIAAVFVGPLSRLITQRFMSGTLKYPEGAYTAHLIMKDALILSPLVIALYIIGYDYTAVMDMSKKVTEVTEKDKNKGVLDLVTKRVTLAKDESVKRYKKPFMEAFVFYVSTAPFVKMVEAFEMIPKKDGRLVAKLYKLIFFAFLSNTITSHQLGPEITKRKTLKEIKNGNKGGGGGLVCRAAGAIAACTKNS